MQITYGRQEELNQFLKIQQEKREYSSITKLNSDSTAALKYLQDRNIGVLFHELLGIVLLSSKSLQKLQFDICSFILFLFCSESS